MDNFFDMNKRFKAEPEEIFIEDECLEEGPPTESVQDANCFDYECSPTTSTFMPQGRDFSVPAILDGQFFEIVTVNETTCTALCKLCEPRRKTINGSLKATGNFYDHIKRMHLSYMSEAETKRGAKRKPRTKKFDPSSLLMIDHDSLSQPSLSSLPTTVFFTATPESCTPESAFQSIFNFVRESMLPPSIVDNESFRYMVEVLSKNNAIKIQSPTSQQIVNALHSSLYSMTEFTKDMLKNREYVCATADFWAKGNDTFVGITGHAIEPTLFQRECFALGFQPVKMDDKTDIANKINQILTKYNIENKVREIVVDNIVHRSDETDEVFTLGVHGFDLEGVPAQLRSFSRSLDLIVTIDVTSKAALRKYLPGDTSGVLTKEYAQVYDSAMTKLTNFWDYLKSSPRASDFCVQACGKVLPVPNSEWPSKFDAIQVISETENLHKIFNQLQHPPLENDEFNFLIDYVRVMQPFATAFNILKESGSFRGVVLPTILSIKCRLEAMSGLQFGESLRMLALRGLDDRFPMLDILSEKSFNYVHFIATISHPAFKMSCLPPEHQNTARDVFLSACSKLSEKYTPKMVESKKESFFSVLKSPKASVDCVTNEALRYLTDDSEELAMLHRYPCVKNIFLEYNTCLSSAAPVERLLKPCKEVFGATSNTAISNQQFEDYLLLKICKHNQMMR